MKIGRQVDIQKADRQISRYKYTQEGWQTNRNTIRQTERYTDRKSGRQVDTEKVDRQTGM
jgi:hypothetical protein